MAAPQPSFAVHKKKAPPTIIKKQVLKKPISTPSFIQSQRLNAAPKPAAKPLANGHRKALISQQSSTPVSRQTSKEPLERVRNERTLKTKRHSPATTPQFDETDDEDEDEQPNKRMKREDKVDPDRVIRDETVFAEDEQQFDMIHAYDIANADLKEHSKNKYADFFTALNEREQFSPDVMFQYPGSSHREKYQLVKPSSDHSDFKPITELFENMRFVANHYLTGADALKVDSEADGSGFYQKLKKHFGEGQKCRAGAQTDFISVVEQYNDFVQSKRKDGTIEDNMDALIAVPLSLVEHIVKGQIYARGVSPQVHLVRQYEGFSDNVYGELLPKFLSRIFKETRLKSSQTFVDLGSGVGNCVLQAALETGCKAYGCEFMANCAMLADLQAREFPARCKLWGIKPGPVKLVHDDFLTNPEINEALKTADVILINNQAFTAELNDKLKLKFLDLKEGCQIVSLKYFRDPNHVIRAMNVNDPINTLRVQEMERFSGAVSWTDDPGKWYIQVKDSKEVTSFIRKETRRRGDE